MDISQAVELAVENVAKEGLTDIFPPPEELGLLKNKAFRQKINEIVKKSINGGSLDSLDVNPIGHVLLPKGGPFDFRKCALIQPLDTIKYLALVLTMASEIEKKRLSPHRHIIYSYRFKPQKGYLFNPKCSYTHFKQHAATISHRGSSKFLVTCDIANFYDRLNLHRLESILLSLKIDAKLVKQLNQLLLFWANRDSYGLPVGSNASRILAEAALLEVDNYMCSIGARFSRFVDDYRFFAPDAHSAHYWLTQLIERLWLEGLTINKSKTKIEEIHPTTVVGKSLSAKKSHKVASSQLNAIAEQQETCRPQFRIVAGYGGDIPTIFRAPASQEIEKLSKTDANAKLLEIKSKQLPTPEDITDLIKSIISTGNFHLFVALPEVADLFPQFTPYIVDVLCKYADSVPSKDRQDITKKFVRRLRSKPPMPEYIAMAIVRLLGTQHYVAKDALLSFFRKLERNAGAYIGRALLDALGPHVSRGEVLEIRRYFDRADAWEKRQITRIVDRHLDEDEKRPWLKNVKTQSARDPFLAEQIKSTPTAP